jgi:CHAD domain-containing protein
MQSSLGHAKWISDLNVETPVADAARRVLTFRLEAVRDCLGQSLRDQENITECIHQLRIATRRAAAALQSFSECLPLKVAESAKRELRGIRRAAGQARDWDVLIGRLMKDSPGKSPDDRPAIDMLVGYAMAHRIPAQTQLAQSCPNYPFGFERFMADTVGAVRYKDPHKTSLASFARPMLAKLIDKLNQVLSEKQSTDYEQLHEVRLAGKRLRYALEIFIDCFGPSLKRQLYPALAELQQLLGDVNDHFSAARRYRVLDAGLRLCFSNGHQAYSKVIERLVKHHESEMAVAGRKFHNWRKQWQRPEMQCAFAEIYSPSAPLALQGPQNDGSDANLGRPGNPLSIDIEIKDQRVA